ncbi:UPF0182 family protein [Antrihabitans sp. YC2-6]|uniref:UPF0182 family protein n=1 Tax=Antrihabitans sp. YC2-6 TaxID=2799498 RepID=UPI0018F61464|nr:UPF0182 family protein [Antrihabitans sp. YC2-6]MBJ8348780.1 UPF0182 family protein [Antrihabitans sp. YC2-6]
MGMRAPAGLPSLSKRSRILLLVALVLGALLLIGPRVVDTYTNWLWFGEVGYRSVYVKVLVTRLILFLVVSLVVGGIVFAALLLAYRTRPVFVPVAGPNDPIARYRTTVMSRLRLFGLGIPILLGLLSGLVAQSNWVTVQMFMHGGEFGVNDPQFGLDIGFYAFDLPFYRMVLNWLFVAVVIAFFANLVTHYIFGGLRLTGREGALTRSARIQLAILAGTFVLLKAIAYWFDRYALLSSDRKEPTFTGASYTDINAVLPAKLILLSIAAICAVAFFAGIFMRDLRVPALATALLVLSSILVGAVFPLVMEQFSVKPNASAKEREYIARNIEATRQAYGITNETVTYEQNWGSANPDIEAISRDAATLSNVRLLDPNLISPTFREQQKLKNFYGFPDVLAMDRYTVDGKLLDFVVAARELRPNQLDVGQRDWINKHTRYTHGNGFIAAPANKVDEVAQDAGSTRGGLPQYSVNDLANIKKPEYKDSPIQVTQPRIYYGELIAQADPDYAIVGANGKPPVEYDEDGVSTTYDGEGGVPIGNWFNRLAFSIKYGERNILLSSEIGDESKILFNRDPRDRVQKAAPWLTTDSKVYPAVIDGRIKWMVDGYTTLDHFPYAQRMSLDDATSDALETTGSDTRTQAKKEVSYIRNSVKATVDAYDGTVTLYQQDESDPVLKAWMGVFPDTVVPKDQIPENLKAHFRYPEDLFKVQRLLLSKYHVDDPLTFFQSNDFWEVPSDPTIPTNTRGLSQPPYYVVASAPQDTGKASFQLTSVLLGLRSQFLSAFVSASSDPDTYGKITVKQLPTNVQTFGPKQVYDQLVSSDKIAPDRTLFEQSTDFKYGNLLTLPVGKDGLLYVEPLYAQAKNQPTAFPKLFRVLVFFNGKIGYAPTIAEALKQAGINADAVTTDPTQSTPGTNGSTDPNQGQVTPPPPDTGTPPPSDGNTGTFTQAQRDAVTKLDQAVAEVRAAQQSGDFERYGRALSALDTAVKGYQSVQGN